MSASPFNPIRITMKRVNDGVCMEAVNAAGVTLRLDGTPDVGGVDGGFTPMQSLLAAAGACSVIDIISILKKKRTPARHIEVDIEGDRTFHPSYSEFNRIQLHYRVFGDVPTKQVEQAMELSLGKYCSVIKALEHTAVVEGTFELLP